VTCSLPADRLEGNQVGCIDHAATGGGTRSSGISSVGCAQAPKNPLAGSQRKDEPYQLSALAGTLSARGDPLRTALRWCSREFD